MLSLILSLMSMNLQNFVVQVILTLTSTSTTTSSSSL